MIDDESEVESQVETLFKLNLIPFFNKLQRVSHTCLKKCSTTRHDCSLATESRLCAGLTESRTQHRWVAESQWKRTLGKIQLHIMTHFTWLYTVEKTEKSIYSVHFFEV